MIQRRSVKDAVPTDDVGDGARSGPGDETEVVHEPAQAVGATDEMPTPPWAEPDEPDEPAAHQASTEDAGESSEGASAETAEEPVADPDETVVRAPVEETESADQAAVEPISEPDGETSVSEAAPAEEPVPDPDETAVHAPVEETESADEAAEEPTPEPDGETSVPEVASAEEPVADPDETAVQAPVEPVEPPVEPVADPDDPVVSAPVEPPVEPVADPDETIAREPVEPVAAPEVDPDETVERAPVEPAAAGLDETVVRPAEPAEPDVTDDPEATLVRTTQGPPSGTEATTATPKPRRRWRKVLLIVGIVIVVLAAAYVAVAWYFGDKVPPGTSVAGVDISGMTAEDAVSELDTRLADLVAEPIPVEAGERSATIDPATAGLTFDAAATVDEVTGFTLDPGIVVGHLLGIGPLAPVVEVDDEALTAAVTATATDLDVAPTDAVIEMADGDATVATEPEDGLAVDVDGSAELVRSEWLTGQRPFVLPAEAVPPTLGEEAVETAMSDIVEPLLSGPVTVQLNDDETSLTPEQLVAAASMPAEGSHFELVLDGEKLADVITEAVPSVGESPTDAKIVFEGGEPTIIPAVTGTGLDPEQLAGVVKEAALATDEGGRVAVAELADTEPEFSTEDAEALGVVEVVGEFSTPYPYDPTRTLNLINGTAHINGTLIQPGETFSLIEALGPITSANGYVSSHVVDGGFVTDAMGGGLSQVSTTTFNAAFEAGMEDITHKPHSRWFDRYPAGREATMFAPSLDMQWGNNTPYGVLVQAWVDQGASRVHVRLWSTDYWDVEIVSGQKYNFTSPRTVYNDNPTCSPESAGPSGFTIDVRRTVSLDGEVNDEYSRSYTWTYQPWNRVVCGSPPSDDESEDSD